MTDKAAHVQAGIDPLVAEIEAGLEGVTPGPWTTRGAAVVPDYPSFDAVATVQVSNCPNWPETSGHIARCSPDNIAKLIAGYRSQAERIAALEVERDALAMRRADEVLCFATAVLHGDDEHREWLLAAARAFIDYEPLPPPNGKGRAEAAESLLAEAREALELHVAYADTPADRGGNNGPKGKAWHAFIDARDATLSRLKPGEKGGGNV